MGVFYRLYDKQTGRYLNTGYNSTSLNEIIQNYFEWYGVDWDKKDRELFKNKTKTDKLDFIQSTGFIIEKSTNCKFKEEDEL